MSEQNAALPILDIWKDYFTIDRNEGLGSSYERIMLNRKLSQLHQRYGFTTLLEAPSFGFTGLSGINSLGVAQQHGVHATVADTVQERLELIQGLWQEANTPMTPAYIESYSRLPFEKKSFDCSWNFASLWFAEDPDRLLQELARVTRRVIILSVPNQHGLGYRLRKYIAKDTFGELLNESAIVPKRIISQMRDCCWMLVERDYIDVPPFPDIAMKKEDFAKLLHMEWLLRLFAKRQDGTPAYYTIMDYYTGQDPEFAAEMLKHAWVERYAPRFVKYFWGHHIYLVFEPA
jgi:SAM-dependent methyltransferase